MQILLSHVEKIAEAKGTGSQYGEKWYSLRRKIKEDEDGVRKAVGGV